MTIRIKRRSQAEWLLFYIFTLPFAFYLLMGILSLPPMIKYTIDIAWVWLAFLIIVNRISIPNKESRIILRVVLLFIGSTILGAIINVVSPIYYLWGFRNNVRFFVFFFSCILFLKERNLESYLKIFDNLFWVNFVLTLYQFFVLGIKQDYLGGIFGVSIGCNSFTNIFLLIVITKSVLLCVHKKERLSTCLCKCAAALLVAALAELKVFFLEIAIVIVMATWQGRPSARKLVIILLSALGAIVAIRVLVYLAPDFAEWFNWETIIETAASDQGYTMSNDMNRLTAITMSWNRFLDSWVNKILGFGLGSCDHSDSFSFLLTPFFKAHSELNYIWFSSAFLILETGVVGLVLYFLLFICIFRYAGKCKKKYPEMLIYAKLSQIMSVMCMIMIIYNSAMRTEAAYMAYFVLALPFVRRESHNEKTNQPA